MRKYIYGAVIGFVLTSLLFVLFFNEAIQYQIAYTFITSNYDGEVDSKTMNDEILSGIVDGLGDEHSKYFSASSYDDFLQELTTTYEGIGIQVHIAIEEPYVTIQSVLENGAASEENIYAGDVIKSVNGEEMTADNAEDVSAMIKSQETVDLVLYRPSTDETIEINTKNKSYQNESVHYQIYEEDGTSNAYIRIDSFVDTTAEEFGEALKELESQGFDKLIIDLRDNPGGDLSILTEIADLIVSNDRDYLTIKRGDKVVDTYRSNLDENKEYPIVVLQNENTASAAEILSAALQEVNGATVMGTTSYGKGSVQRLFALPFSNSGMKITIEHWYTADDEIIDKQGITPDVELEDESLGVYQIPLESKLSLGDENVSVYLVKNYLKMLGDEQLDDSNTFDAQTEASVRAFQSDNELDPTGIVDVETAKKLYDKALVVEHDPKNDNIVEEAISQEE